MLSMGRTTRTVPLRDVLSHEDVDHCWFRCVASLYTLREWVRLYRSSVQVVS